MDSTPQVISLFSRDSERFDINPPWEVKTGQFQVTPNKKDGNYIQAVGNSTNSIHTASTHAYGEWSFKMKRIKDYNEFWPISLNKERWMWAAQGYLLWTNINKDGTPYDGNRLKGLVLSRSDAGSGVDLASFQDYSPDNQWTTIQIKRDRTGLWQVLMDSEPILLAVDNTYTSNICVHLSISEGTLNGFTDISFSPK